MYREPENPTPKSAPMALLAAADLQDSLMGASNDLDRLQRLLSDAPETLTGHFYGASRQINKLSLLAAHQSRLQGLPDLPGWPESNLHLALGHLSGAVTTRGLRHCADRLARDVMGDDEDGATMMTDAPLRPNPVTQDEMDASSIELF